MKITFIQTGGTIDKDYPRTTKGYAFEITEPAVKRILEKLNPSFDYEIIPLLQKDSLDLTDDDRELLVNACREIESNLIIITHGTDTMIKTAEQLQNMKGKIIVLAGAFRPERFSDSDADINLGIAIGAIQSLVPGVYIAMSGLVLPYDRVGRDDETGQFVER